MTTSEWAECESGIPSIQDYSTGDRNETSSPFAFDKVSPIATTPSTVPLFEYSARFVDRQSARQLHKPTRNFANRFGSGVPSKSPSLSLNTRPHLLPTAAPTFPELRIPSLKINQNKLLARSVTLFPHPEKFIFPLSQAFTRRAALACSRAWSFVRPSCFACAGLSTYSLIRYIIQKLIKALHK